MKPGLEKVNMIFIFGELDMFVLGKESCYILCGYFVYGVEFYILINIHIHYTAIKAGIILGRMTTDQSCFAP